MRVTGRYKMETFNFNIFLNSFSSNNSIGSSSKIVVAPKDKDQTMHKCDH